jgi:hypothetical protein
MVAAGLLISFLISLSPVEITVPEAVEQGDVFRVTVSCNDTRCRSLQCTPQLSSGLEFAGSSTSSSYSSIHTPSGYQTRQEFLLVLMIRATGSGMQTIGPFQVYIGGLGTYTLPAESLMVGGQAPSSEALETGSQRLGDKVWIEAVPEYDGRIYPGVPFRVLYYCYARIYTEDFEYWWSAPEFGTATCVDSPEYLDWKMVEHGLQRCTFCVLEITPACPGSLLVPEMEAFMQERVRNPLLKALEYYPVSSPVTVPVYPFPDGERPSNWNGSLTDSVFIVLEKLDIYSGQGGEHYLRFTVTGPGAASLEELPELTLGGPGRLLRGDSGEGQNKKWWDLIVDPTDTGQVVIGPDSIAWFDRESARFVQAYVPACTLIVEQLPWNPVELEFEPEGAGGFSFWLYAAIVLVSITILFLLIRTFRRRSGAVHIEAATDSEELMTGFEAGLSSILRGRAGYLGSEELSDLLDEHDVDNILGRRIIRFWKDVEQLLAGREPPEDEFLRMREYAIQLIDELDEKLSS